MEDEAKILNEVKELGLKLSKDQQDAMSALNKEIENIKGQLKSEGQASADTLKRFEDIDNRLKESSEKLGADLSTLATRINQNPALFGGQKEAQESLQVQIEAALTGLTEKGFFNNIKNSASVDIKGNKKLFDVKAVGDMSNSNLSGGYASREIRSNVIYDPVRPVRIRELISVTPMNSPVIEYPKETGGEGGVGIQTEGSAKSQIDFDLSFSSATPKTVAVYARSTKQALQDIPYLASYLSRRMTDKWFDFEDNQLLNGDNTGVNFNGILTQAIDYVKTAGTGSTYYEYLADAVAQLKNTHYTPGSILVNALDFVRLVTYKASSSGEFTHPGLIYGTDGILRFFGVPIIESSAIARLTGLVGDMRQVDLAVREALNFAVSYEDGTNFTTNKVTYRLEGREALLVYDIKAFRAINFAEIAS